MKYLIVVFYFSLILLGFFKPAHSSSIEVNKPLVIAVNQTSYPYHFQNKQGQAQGVMVDLWKLWAQKQGVEVEFKVSNWKNTLDNVLNGQVDIHAGMSKTQNRVDSFDFTNSFFYQSSYILIHRDYTHITNLEQLLPFAIGVVKNSSHVEQIRQLHPKIKIRAYGSRFELFDAALRGEIIAFTNLDQLSQNYPHYKQLNNMFPPVKQLLFHKGEYVGAVAKNNQALLSFVNDGLAKITQKEKSTIEKNWLGLEKKNDVLTITYTPELPPYMYISPTGKAQGLFIDLWRLWSEQTGLPVEFIPNTLVDSIEVINQEGADIQAGFPLYEEALKFLQPAHKVYSSHSGVYVHNSIIDVKSLGQLAGKKVGVFDTAPYKTSVMERYPDIELVVYREFEEMLNGAESGEIDAMIAASENMTTHLLNANLYSTFYLVPDVSFEVDIFALVKKGNDKLAEMISEGFSLIPIEKQIQLEKRWLTDSNNGYYNLSSQKIALTIKEKQFLDRQEKIKIGYRKNWKPVAFMDNLGAPQGINAEINRIIERRIGLKFTYVEYDSWDEMFNGLITREVDLIASATSTAERRQSFLFSQSYWDMPWVVVHPRSRGNERKLSDFYGKELAIIKGYYLINEIRKKHPQISLRIVTSLEEGLVAVQKGLVSGLIENIASASELVKKENLVPLSMSGIEEFNVDQNSYAIRKDWPQLQSAIDKAISTITDSEIQQIYEKWFDVKIETGFDKNTVLKVSAQVAVIAIVIIAIIIVWNRRLYVEIQMRKSLQEKMKHMATHDELTGLANRVLLKDRINTAINFHQRQSLQMAVLFIDLDGFKLINDNYGHDVGDELLIQVAGRLSDCVRKSDTIVRFGGDEFVLLLTGLHNQDEAAFISEKVLKLVQQPFKLSVIEANIGCSIGIAMYPDDGQSSNDLLKEADTLMYQVKAAGKNHYTFKK